MAFNWFAKSNVLIPYFTLGDPSISESEALVRAAFDNGAGIVELGIPFSDPIADGPVIQASHLRALSSGESPTISAGLNVVQRVKQDYSKPIVFMLSVNLIMSYGVKKFFNDAKIAGLDGVVIPDLPFEEASDYLAASRRSNVAIVFLVSPLCSPERLEQIVRATEGFLYLISTTGTTGARDTMATDLPAFVEKIKAIRDIPVAVGFGISKPRHVKEVMSYADGAIVGSHLVTLLSTKGSSSVIHEISEFAAV